MSAGRRQHVKKLEQKIPSDVELNRIGIDFGLIWERLHTQLADAGTQGKRDCNREKMGYLYLRFTARSI